MSSVRSPTRARRWPARQRPQQTIQAANEQSAALGRLLVVVENYPQLRSSESFNRLMDELSGTENRIAVERMRYNERVQDYNITRRQFPSNITAGILRLQGISAVQRPAGCGAGAEGEFRPRHELAVAHRGRTASRVRSRDGGDAEAARACAGGQVHVEAAREVDVARASSPPTSRIFRSWGAVTLEPVRV